MPYSAGPPPPLSGGSPELDVPVHVRICAEPISAERVRAQVSDPGAGAIVTFEGVTREIERLDYEAYTTMAQEYEFVLCDATGKELRAAAGGVTAEGRIKTHWICPDCGTRISGSPKIGTDQPGYQRIVLGGTLDDTSWLRPTTHVWTRSKQPWIVFPEGDEIFDTVRKL